MRKHTGNRSFDARVELYKAFDMVRDSAPEYGFIWGPSYMAGHKEIQLKKPEKGTINLFAVVHELIHVAGFMSGRLSSDIDISNTVKALGIVVYTDSGSVMERGEDRESDSFKNYWGQALKNSCPSIHKKLGETK